MLVIQIDSTNAEHKVSKNITGFIDGYDRIKLYINDEACEFELIRGIVKLKDYP
ncbi:MAG: hypothetical protein ACRCZW_13205 [Lactobacillaceae bacterium]